MSGFAKRLSFGLQSAAMCAFVASPALAQSQSGADFFKHQSQLTMVVASGAGGGYDQIARLVAQNLSRFMPGQPKFVIQDMPGAAGVVATNYLYNAAPKDGSTILAGTNSALVLPVYGSKVAKFDARRFAYIGSTGKQQAICVTSKKSGIATLDDAKTHTVTVSATAVSNGPGMFPRILNDMIGTKFKLVTGYDTSGMRLAVEQGEVEGLCGYAYQTYLAIGSPWFKNHTVNIIAQMGLHKNPDLPNVPLVRDLLTNPTDKQVFDLIVLPQEFGRPFFAPPGTPADRLAIYRSAFKQMMKDKTFLAEAKKQRVIIEAVGGDKIESLLDQAYSAPQKVRDRADVYEDVQK